MNKLILASNSPRRKEILSNMNIPFEVFVSNCDESYPSSIEKAKIPMFLSQKKAESVYNSLPLDKKNIPILAADTMILFNDKLYGKPKDKNEAFNFLKEFQGNIHDVITGVTLFYDGKYFSELSCTHIHFKKMSDSEIEWNLSKNEWQDAAGAYKIQGITACFIEKIDGSYSNVVGLPISTVYDMLKKQGFDFS